MKMSAGLVLVTLVLMSGTITAHHGRGATYDMNKQVTLKGVVSEVAWRNPHVVVYMDVKDQDGSVVNWAFENSSVSTLARQGYNRNTLKVGQEITAIVNPSAQGAPRGIVVKVVLADGREIMSRERGDNPLD
jgi:hypothetical protein